MLGDSDMQRALHITVIGPGRTTDFLEDGLYDEIRVDTVGLAINVLSTLFRLILSSMAPTMDSPILHPIMLQLDVPTSRTNVAPTRRTQMIQADIVEAK